MTTVALVPAFNRADRVGETVRELAGLATVDDVVVVDDGSSDETAAVAAGAGATVLRLGRNAGKGSALTAGVEATPDADVYLLVDADLGESASGVSVLLEPVLAGRAGMTVGVLPPAAGRGGFGLVRSLARRGIRRATGLEMQAPLSGQRAVRADVLRAALPLADRFGLETALTIDVARAGAAIAEVPIDADHRHTGRSLGGFVHRGRQGRDIFRALWPRLTTKPVRTGIILAAAATVIVASLYGGTRWEPGSVPATARPHHVILFGIPRLGWDDVGTGRMPQLDGLARRGAVAAASVRTRSLYPNTAEAYASLGAGTRVVADQRVAAAFDAAAGYEGGTAAQALTRRTGAQSDGAVVVLGAAVAHRLQSGKHLSSLPGALGDALTAAGRRAGVVGNADATAATDGRPVMSRPVAAAMMSAAGVVADGEVGPGLLQADPSAPFGVRADADKVLAATMELAARDDIVAVDPGDTDRATAFAAVSTSPAAAGARRRALADTDALLGRVVAAAGPDTLVVVVGVDPPTRTWHTTPIVAVGAGVVPGYLHSPSVRRLGVVTLTDLAPTLLDAVRVKVPSGMIGHALRYHPGTADLGKLRRLDRDAAFRERIYFPMTLGYIIFQALVYLAVILASWRFGGAGRWSGALRLTVLSIAAWPLATFVLRAIPGVPRLGVGGADALLIALAVAIGLVAGRARRRPLSALSWILAATITLLLADLALGARLQTSSILGYSLHTAARFTGIGNTAFAVLAASTILVAVAHLVAAPRRNEALVAVGALFAVVIVVDGAPSLGDDVGGILTLVPLLAVALLVLAGRRLRPRTILISLAAAGAAVGLALGVDLLRPPQSRTHLGRLVGDVKSGGSGQFTTTVLRKLTTNVHTYKSVWCWVIVVVAAYLLFLLGYAKGWRRLLPPGGDLRVGVVITLIVGLAGNILNDSGAVVTALVFVYVGPFMTLLAIDDQRPPAELVEPATAGAPPVRIVPVAR